MEPLKPVFPPEGKPSLRLEHWSVWYGQAQALFDVNLFVSQGECVALLGRNGAGKTTLIQSILGLVPKRQGQLVLEGQDLLDLEPFELARMGLGWVPEDRRIFAQLSVMENLRLGFRVSPQEKMQGHSSKGNSQQQFANQLDHVLTLFPLLSSLLKRSGSHLSGGEQQMLSMARALMSKPQWLLMDEVSEGVAPQVLDGLMQAVHSMSQMGVSILMAEQNIGFVRGLCHKAYVLERGRIVACGDRSSLSDPHWIDSQLQHLS
jgi:branched-chain amino acid transport system ATP-binding protein